MKILVIDYLSPKGHEGWFKLQIESLLSLGHNVKCVFKEGFNENVGLSKDNILFQIPSFYYTTNKGLKYRFESLRILHFIKKRVKEEEWDVIIFSSYETISLGFYPIFKSALIINHNNLSDLGNNSLKVFFYRRLSKIYTPVAFNEYIAQGIKKITNVNPYIIPHGLQKIEYKQSTEILHRLGLIPKHYLISPTRSNSDLDKEFLKNICNSEIFNHFLETEHMKLLLRVPIDINAEFRNHFIMEDIYLSENDYYNLLFNCYATIYCLKEDQFKYRVSASLFECMVLGVSAFVHKVDSLSVYAKYRNGKLLFTTPEELVKHLLDSSDAWNSHISEISSPTNGWKSVLLSLSN